MILHNREARLPSDILERSMELDEDNAAVEPVKIESQTIGRYRLLYELGAGGMATVFLARAEGPGGFAKPVAIKRIHPHLSKRKELVEMFLDEARLASLISHPNVCNTFDFGEDQGTYYLAMEYLVGEPLNVVELRVTRVSELLGSRRWQRTLAKIVADACEGLHAAHEQKDERGRPLDVVHRDVSPHNVFVTYDGAVKVLDFGVAFAADRITKTVTGGIKGKLGYLAPEQLAHAAYDRRLDVWAIGIVLWEGLTGQRLFLGRTEVDTILAVENKVIAAPSSVIGSIPRELDAIAARCLSRAQADRYPTARAIARDLHAFLASSGPPLTSVEVGELVSEVCRDRREARVEVAATVANDETAAQDAETSQTRTVGGEATVLHDGGPPRGSLGAERDTDIRAPAPFAPLAVARLVPALAPSLGIVVLVAAVVLEGEQFGRAVAEVHGDQAEVAADAVALVHHRVAHLDLGQVAQHVLGRGAFLAFAAGAPARRGGVELGLGDQRHPVARQDEAVVHRRDGQAERHVAVGKGGETVQRLG
jgi:serine/threonine-protein kinase